MALSTCGFGRSRVMKSVHPRGVHSCWRGAVCLLPGCRNLFAQLRIPNYAKELHDLFATDLSSFPDALKGAQVVVLAQLNCQRRHLVGPCINSSESLSSSIISLGILLTWAPRHGFRVNSLRLLRTSWVLRQLTRSLPQRIVVLAFLWPSHRHHKSYAKASPLLRLVGWHGN